MSIEAVIQYAKTMVDISNSKTFDDFVTHVDLVMEGVRAAYFFDSSIINLQKAREIICCMSSYFKIMRKVVLITLSDDTGDGKPDQYAVISPMRLMDSYQMLQKSEWAFSFLPLSICSIAPFHCTDGMMRAIQSELLVTLEPLYKLCLKCNIAPHVLQFEPIASDINIVKVLICFLHMFGVCYLCSLSCVNTVISLKLCSPITSYGTIGMLWETSSWRASWRTMCVCTTAPVRLQPLTSHRPSSLHSSLYQTCPTAYTSHL